MEKKLNNLRIFLNYGRHLVRMIKFLVLKTKTKKIKVQSPLT